MSQHEQRDDIVKNNTGIVEFFRRLWPHFKAQAGLTTLTLFAVVVLVVSGRLLPSVFGYAIDEGILKQNKSVLLWAALAYLGLEILKTYMMFLHSYLFAKIGNRILFDIRSQLIAHTQSLPIPFFDRNPTGRIVTRVTNDVVSVGELFNQGIITIFSNVLSLIAIVVSMFAISPKMAFYTLMIGPPMIYIGLHLSNRIRVVLRESKKRLAAINAFVAENINGMRVLQLYRSIDKNSRKFQKLSADYREVQMQSVVLYALMWPAVNFFNAASILVALYVGGLVSRSGAISMGAMVAFLLNVRDFIHPLRTILEKYQVFQNSLSGAERIFTLLDEKPEDPRGNALENFDTHGEIQFSHLSFRYSENLPMVLKDINLHILPGESVALVGRTGSGKSSMIALLQRFYDYSDGQILLDKLPLNTIAKNQLRQRIGVVQQDAFMFRGTISENISLRDPRITREQIEFAARQAKCFELFSKHHGGLDAPVEERGANLSFGERQLIAFARILAFNPDILILDEATANIDSQSEALIQQATKEITRHRTSIIIAHRISTILDCDKIVVLDSGNIVEVGNHAELTAKRGIYFKLCQSQFRPDEQPDEQEGLIEV